MVGVVAGIDTKRATNSEHCLKTFSVTICRAKLLCHQKRVSQLSRNLCNTLKLNLYQPGQQRFRNVFAKHPGSVHDAMVFKDSTLYKYSQEIISQMQSFVQVMQSIGFPTSSPNYGISQNFVTQNYGMPQNYRMSTIL